MSKYLLTAPAVALAAAATPSHAQSTDWTGFYVGGHVGIVDAGTDWAGSNTYQTVLDGGEGNFTVQSQTVAVGADTGKSEISGGGRIGFNVQSGNLLFGIEADATMFDYDGIATATQGGSNYTVSSHASRIATLRARAGLTFGNAVVFATGGFAFSNLEHTLTANNTSEIVIDGGEGGSSIGTVTHNLAATSSKGNGWTIGGGGEFLLTPNMSLALTVLHVDLGPDALAATTAPSSVAATVDSKMLIGMLGVNFRF